MTQTKNFKVLEYKGQLHFSTIDDILDIYRDTIKKLNISKVTEKRTFAILVECLENSFRHNKQQIDTEKQGYVELRLDYVVDKFKITISNYIKKDEIKNLISKIDEINNIGVSGLSPLYRKLIAKAKISEKGGAGLGMVEIARNSGLPLEYNIKEIDNTHIFELIVYIKIDY